MQNRSRFSKPYFDLLSVKKEYNNKSIYGSLEEQVMVTTLYSSLLELRDRQVLVDMARKAESTGVIFPRSGSHLFCLSHPAGSFFSCLLDGLLQFLLSFNLDSFFLFSFELPELVSVSMSCVFSKILPTQSL